MSDNDQILREFCGITGATVEDGKFFLESAVWNLEDALASFYETVSGGSPPERSRERSESPEFMEVPTPNATESSSSKKPNADRPKITTLFSMKKRDSDSDEEEGQRFYAGGSTHSGQEVLGPGRANADLISELFRSVKELGGVESAPVQSQNRFGGTGYRLGMTSDDSQAVAGNANNPRTRRELTLRLWRDGFSINDEPLRSYTDPDDREFLRKIRSGQVPPELVEDSADETLHLNMEDHRHENFPTPSRPPRRAFAGHGYMLGSVVPSVISSDPAPSVPAAPQTPVNIPPKPVVDDKAPTTTISVRLNDGSRVQATLNHTHTIDDLRSYLINLRPELSNSNFSLLTSFPSKELTENSQTLQQAGILNSSLMMRLSK